MSKDLEYYTGTNESPFKVTMVIIEDKVFYKVERKSEIEPLPDISLGLGDAINLAKDILPKLASSQYSLFLTSVSFSEKLYILTQKSYENQKLNPNLDMELEHEANILNALVSSVVDTYGGGKTGKKILDNIFKDNPLYETITGKIKGSIGDAVGEVVSDKYKEYMNEGRISKPQDNSTVESDIENTTEKIRSFIDENSNETTIDTQNGTSKTTLDDGTVIENTPTQTNVIHTDGTKDTVSLENGNLTKTTYDENNNQVGSIPLKSGQTISHIAQKTDFNSIDLLEYNNLTLEEAKSLPVGYKVLVQKEQALLEFDNEHFKEIDAIHWQEVFAKAEELQIDEPHYSEDFNKLNSEITKYNYEIHEENEELLEVDINDYLDTGTENSNTNFQLPASKNLWINNEFYERKVA